MIMWPFKFIPEQRSAVDFRPNPVNHLFLQIKFYENTATPIHLNIIYGSIFVAMVELNSYNRDPMAHKT